MMIDEMVENIPFKMNKTLEFDFNEAGWDI